MLILCIIVGIADVYVGSHSSLLSYYFLFLRFLYLFDCGWSLLLQEGFLSGSHSLTAARVSHFSGFSCGTQALELAGFSSCGGLSCSTACGIFPDQGLNLHPLHW